MRRIVRKENKDSGIFKSLTGFVGYGLLDAIKNWKIIVGLALLLFMLFSVGVINDQIQTALKGDPNDPYKSRDPVKFDLYDFIEARYGSLEIITPFFVILFVSPLFMVILFHDVISKDRSSRSLRFIITRISRFKYLLFSFIFLNVFLLLTYSLFFLSSFFLFSREATFFMFTDTLLFVLLLSAPYLAMIIFSSVLTTSNKLSMFFAFLVLIINMFFLRTDYLQYFSYIFHIYKFGTPLSASWLYLFGSAVVFSSAYLFLAHMFFRRVDL